MTPLQSSAAGFTDDSLIGTAADRVVAGMGWGRGSIQSRLSTRKGETWRDDVIGPV